MDAPANDTAGNDATSQGIQQLWERRIRTAKAAKKTGDVVPRMLVELAFASGNTWHVWDRQHRKVRRIDEVDPRYADRELYSVNLIREYRSAQLGELASYDDRPTLLAVQEGETAEEAAEQLNAAVSHAWEHEWGADKALRRARAYTVDNGVAAVRCRWNPNVGKPTGHLPMGQDGQPIRDQAALDHLQQQGTLPDGSLPQFRQLKEGRTEWKAYSALQVLPPPGCVHEDEFPWEILLDVAAVDDLKAEYGPAAAGLQEDPDIGNAMGMTVGQEAAAGQAAQGRLRGFCWLYLCFQRPSKRWPDGRTAVVASNQYTLLDSQDQFDYRTPAGEPDTGIRYLHWWRRSDSFWSQSFVGAMQDPQRIIDRRETQNLEIIDRGMPKVYIHDGDLVEEPRGVPMEIVRLNQSADPPVMFPGAGPGGWMYQDIDHHAANLSHASTMSTLRLGENPQNVDTYSQLALLNENEAVKRSVIQIEHRAAVGDLVELSVGDMQRYWPPQKQILVAGDDDRIGFAFFEKAKMPPFFMVKVAKGAPQPRSQGAELKKLDAIWAAAVQSWVAVNDAQTWVKWYADSLEAGEPIDLPEAPKDSQQENAKLENLLMQQGVQPPVMDYDIITVHLPEHRRAEDEARAAGDLAAVLRINRHVQDHIAMAQENAAKAAAAANGLAGPQGPQPIPAGTSGPQDTGGGVVVQPPFAHEPQPQVIPHAFSSLAAGQ